MCVFFCWGENLKKYGLKDQRSTKINHTFWFGLMKVIYIYIHIDLSCDLLCLGMDCRTIQHGKLYDFRTQWVKFGDFSVANVKSFLGYFRVQTIGHCKDGGEGGVWHLKVYPFRKIISILKLCWRRQGWCLYFFSPGATPNITGQTQNPKQVVNQQKTWNWNFNSFLQKTCFAKITGI